MCTDGVLRRESAGTRPVVAVDPHIQRIVLAAEETTVTQQVSHRPIKYQSRLWSQKGTEANRSHRCDNPLLRPTGIQIATKNYATPQTMAPTNVKTINQISLLRIESNLDRLGLLSPTHDQRSQQQSGQITLQPVLINKSKFLVLKVVPITFAAYRGARIMYFTRRFSLFPSNRYRNSYSTSPVKNTPMEAGW